MPGTRTQQALLKIRHIPIIKEELIDYLKSSGPFFTLDEHCHRYKITKYTKHSDTFVIEKMTGEERGHIVKKFAYIVDNFGWQDYHCDNPDSSVREDRIDEDTMLDGSPRTRLAARRANASMRTSPHSFPGASPRIGGKRKNKTRKNKKKSLSRRNNKA